MWTRPELKADAKNFLRKHWKKAIVISLLAAILSGGVSSQEEIGRTMRNRLYIYYQDATTDQGLKQDEVDEDAGDQYQVNFLKPQYDEVARGSASPIFFQRLSQSLPFFWFSNGVKWVVGQNIFLILVLVSLIWNIFIKNLISIGLKYFYTKGYSQKVKISDLFYGFREGRYRKLVGKLFLKNLYLFLWFLLFFIPGVYKLYQYYYVEYLLMDQPDLSLKEAIEISKKMTEGDKMNIFILLLSFIGWIFLSFFLLNIPLLILGPYMQATVARLYLVRKEAFSSSELFEKEEWSDPLS